MVVRAKQGIIPWLGRAHIGLGWAAFLGKTGDNRAHAHHALQVVVGFGSPARIWTNGKVIAVNAAVVPSDVIHALLPSNSDVGLLYIDSESNTARELMRQLAGASPGPYGEIWHVPTVNAVQVACAFERAVSGHPQGLQALLGELIAQRNKAPETVPAQLENVDATLARVVERLHCAEHLNFKAVELAAWAHLSTSRFGHRFRDYTGMPLRPYLRWLRLQKAAASIVAGASATTAAHAAGFADAAHLSRTFARHFGIAPSTLARLATNQVAI